MITFKPNCTLPSSPPAFVATPSTRSTLQIVWSCASILILCTWSILPINVPPQVDSSTFRQRFHRTWYFLFRKLKWMVITLLVPEWIFAMACDGLWHARKHGNILSRLAQEDGVQWTIAHTFYANMGGFVLEFDNSDIEENSAQGLETDQPSKKPNIEVPTPLSDHNQIEKICKILNEFPGHAMEKFNRQGHMRWRSDPAYRIMARELLAEALSRAHTSNGILMIKIEEEDEKNRTNEESAIELNQEIDISSFARYLTTVTGTTWTLSATQLLKARSLGIIRKLPNLRIDELEDKDNTDIVAKVLAFTQIVWLIIQLCSRWKEGKSCSQLEIMTLSFAVLSILVYSLHWSRPHDVATPTVIPAKRASKSQMQSICLLTREPGPGNRNLYTFPSSTFHAVKLEYSDRFYFAAGPVGAVLFGAFHLIAWNFVFPTGIERMLWHVSSFITVFCPTGLIGLLLLMKWAASDSFTAFRAAVVFVGFIFIPLALVAYILARIFLLVESFRTLYFLPPDAFTATWAANFPHFS